MATTIKIKHSTTAGNAPSSLAQGELAINVADGNLFYGDGSGVSQDFTVNTITAEQYIVSSSVTNVTFQQQSGSTIFGDSTDDTHIFTGSVNITGSVTATSFTGDGTGLSGVGTVDTTGTPASNQLAIFSDANTIQGISDLSITTPAPNTYILNIDVQETNFTGKLDIDDAVNNGAVVDINNTYNQLMTTTHYALKVAGGDAFGAPGSGIAFGGHFLAGNTNTNNPDSIALYAQGHEDGAPNSYAAIFSGSAGGIVGINTMEPTVELDVVGDISASNNIVANGDIRCDNLTVATSITSVGDDIILKDNLIVSSSAGAVSFRGTAGGSNEGVLYLDSGGTGRFAMLFPGSDVVAITNRASNGTVQIRANSSTAGSGGEVTVATFEDDLIKLDVPQRRLVEVSTTTDGNGNGDFIKLGSTATTAGKIYCYTANSTWVETDADTAVSSSGLLGVAMSNNSSKGMLLKGMVTLDHDPGTIGDTLYLSTNTAQASSTAPNGSGDIVRVIGYCLDSSNGQIYFDPSKDHIVHS